LVEPVVKNETKKIKKIEDNDEDVEKKKKRK